MSKDGKVEIEVPGAEKERCKEDCPDDCAECIEEQKTGQGGAMMDECLGKSLEQLSSAFMASARRWELIVYPSLMAFILLAGYGFYLIYSLTTDVSRVANHMETITGNMQQVSQNLKLVSENMNNVSRDVNAQSVVMAEMVVHMRDMNTSMKSMNASMDHLRYSMAVMNNSVSRPMQFMNSFMPW
jgi:uncharacterized protein YoxC